MEESNMEKGDSVMLDRKSLVQDPSAKISQWLTSTEKIAEYDTNISFKKQLDEVKIFYPAVANYIKYIEGVLSEAKNLINELKVDYELAEQKRETSDDCEVEIDLVPLEVSQRHLELFGLNVKVEPEQDDEQPEQD